MARLFEIMDPLLLLVCAGGLMLFTLLFFTYQSITEKKSRSEVKKRLSTKREYKSAEEKNDSVVTAKSDDKKLSKKVAKRANEFYASSDPKSVRKLQMKLMKAGYLDPGAVGKFIAVRFGVAFLAAAFSILLVLTAMAESEPSNKILTLLLITTCGYFMPNVYLWQRTSKLETQNRNGFPDVMDLMVVAGEAGLTMEASIERISQEIAGTYPNLSMQLNIAALEMRAGRPLDQALRSFGERLNLDEVQGFATMVQQSKELGTSISDALRVYSDEMRHKRMMRAEEKAYALPAKMSIPVTVFIMPIVIGVALIPTIVRITTGNY